MTTDERPVLVIGSASMDIAGRALGAIEKLTSNDAIVRTSRGGVARNIAENLARLGQETILIAAVGDDPSGISLATQAAEYGIDTSHMIMVPGARTGSYLAVLDEQGFLKFGMADMSIAVQITPETIHQKQELFAEAALVVIDANLSPETLQAIFEQAHASQVRVCADPTSSVLAQRLKPYLDQLYFVTPNPSETEVLSGVPVKALNREGAISAAQRLIGAGVKVAAVTMAEFGVGYATSTTSGHVPAIATDIVNQTGAGDALTAGVIFGLLNDIPLDDAVRLGVSAATLTLRSPDTVVPDLSLEHLYDQLVI